MEQSPETQESTRKIYPMMIPGMHPPVTYPQAHDGGIPLSLYDDKPRGLGCVIDPWDNMDLHDTVRIYVNNSSSPNVTHEITDRTQLGQRQELDIPKGLLREGVNTLHYSVSRISDPSTPEWPDRPLNVLYFSPRPGAPDQGSVRLDLPPDVIGQPIDAQRAARGVITGFNYSYKRAGDRIHCRLGTVSIDRTVLPGEAGPGTPVVTTTLTTSHFTAATDNPRTPIYYDVVDLLNNRSPTSATTYLDVRLQTSPLILHAPKMLEAKELNGTRLNFVKDFYEAPSATITVDYTGSATGQMVKVYVKGRVTTYSTDIQTISHAGQTLTFTLPRAEVIDACPGKLGCSYTVRLPGTTENLPSDELDVTVTGQKYILQGPTRVGTNIRAYYPTLDGQYTVRVRLLGITTRDSDEIDVTQPEYTNVGIPQMWLTENRGRSVMWNYNMKKKGATEPLIFSWYLREDV